MEANLYKSLIFGSSNDASFWLTRTSFLFEDIATLRASIDLGLPTNKVVTIPGKTTTSLNGINGKSDLTSLIKLIYGYLFKYQLPEEDFLDFVFNNFIGSVFDLTVFSSIMTF